MPVYPGTEGPRFETGTTIERDGFAERLVSMFSHTGTHMDAPAHLLPGAACLDDLPASRFVGRAVVLDARSAGPGGRIGLEAVAAIAPRMGGASFLVIRTGWEELWGEPGYFEGFPTLDAEAAAELASGFPGLSGVAVDAISVDPVGVADLPIHRILLGAGLVIVENLRGLEEACAGSGAGAGAAGGSSCTFELACLPLALASADGAPVRAVAILR
jgi:kynurenine formamidase